MNFFCVCVCVCQFVPCPISFKVPLACLSLLQLVPDGSYWFQLVPHFRIYDSLDAHGCIFLIFLQILSQINSKTGGCRITVIEKLKKMWADKKHKINFYRRIFGKFLEKDTDNWHLTNEVRHFFFKY